MLFLVARWLHIVSTTATFAALWAPLAARKGSPLHRRVGWGYVGAMSIVAATGIGISGARFIESRSPFALFLMYVGVLSAASSFMGVRVLRAKERTGAHAHPFDLGLAALVVLLALVTTGYGIALNKPLLYGFAPVGLWSGSSQLYYWLRTPTERMHWWFEHMGAMIGSGIGSITAMLVVNARHVGLNGLQLAIFLGPTAVGVVGIKLWERRYRRAFACESLRKRPAEAAAIP